MITIVGTPGNQGVYILRIGLDSSIRLAFGRFAGGHSFLLPAGEYLYVGSALGKRGATTLAGRLLRHATRCGQAPAHPIREVIMVHLTALSLSARVPTQKRCHWHVDYLLDHPAASLHALYALCTTSALESQLARRLMAMVETTTIMPNLGASDDRGATHLLRVDAPAHWWQTLPALLQELGSMS